MSNEQRETIIGSFQISEEILMKAPWHDGDESSTTCTVCGKQVRARYETRDIRMQRSSVTFSNILVSVCGECDSMISLPRQSIAQIRELSNWK